MRRRSPIGRYIILGAGAVGATIGWALQVSGQDVVLVARGAHLAALEVDGLVVRRPDGDHIVSVTAVGTPGDARPEAGDTVILATKSQDAAEALDALLASAHPDVVVACATNGVDAERQALRRFDHVLGVCTIVAATHLDPGVVVSLGAPRLGLLDLGPFGGRTGSRDAAGRVSADLDGAGFSSTNVDDVLPRKYRKLIHNTGNAIDALLGPDADADDLPERTRSEAEAVLVTAGVEVMSREDDGARRSGVSAIQEVAGLARGGGSTWQSLARGAGSVETDYLNGEVALEARRHGVPAPLNAGLQREMRRLVANGGSPGSLSLADLERRLTG